MATNRENIKERKDDNLPAAKIDWSKPDAPAVPQSSATEAARQERVKTAVRLESDLAAAGAAYLAHMGTGGGIAAIPHTGPAQYVVAGTMAAISKVLGEQTQPSVPGVGGITSIEGLARYDYWQENYQAGMDQKPDGEYVRFADVAAAALASQSQAAQPTIDTPKLRELIEAHDRAIDGKEMDAAYDAIVAHVAHIAGTSQATKAQAEPIYQTVEGEFGEHWGDTDKAGYDAANKEGILTRIVYAAPVAKEAPAVPEGATNCTLNGGDVDGNQVFVSMDGKPSTHLWTVGGRAYLCEAAPATKAVPEGWREVLQGMRNASYTITQYSETADVVFDSIISALADLEADAKEAAAPVASVAVDATREAETGVQAEKDEQQANVLPPTRGTDGQLNASLPVLTEQDVLAALASITDEPPKRLPPGWLKFARKIESEVVSRFCAQREDKTAESSDVATTTSTVTTSTVSAPTESQTRDYQWLLNGAKAKGYQSIYGAIVAAPSSTEGAQKAPEDVLNEAFEKAAQVAEETDVASFTHAMVLHDDGSQTRSDIAKAIRALRTSSTDQANADTEKGGA